MVATACAVAASSPRSNTQGQKKSVCVPCPLEQTIARGPIEHDPAAGIVRPTVRGFDFLLNLQEMFLLPAASAKSMDACSQHPPPEQGLLCALCARQKHAATGTSSFPVPGAGFLNVLSQGD